MSSSRTGDNSNHVRVSARRRGSSSRNDGSSSVTSSTTKGKRSSSSSKQEHNKRSSSGGTSSAAASSSLDEVLEKSTIMGTGGCLICKQDNDHAKLMLCEGCNGEYHIYCLNPPLEDVPEDDWFCGTYHHDCRSTTCCESSNRAKDVWCI